MQKRCKNPQVRSPTKKSLAARDPPAPPYPSNRPPRPTPIGTPSQAPLLGLALALSLVVRGLPHSGVSAGRSRAKKKSTTRLSCHGAERSLVGSEPPSRAHPETDCVFWGRSLEKQLRFGGVARADPKKDLLSFCCFGEPSRGVVWRGRSWGCYFPESPRGSAGRSRPGCGAGEKRGRNLRWPGPRACTRSACPSRQRGPCLTRRRRSASPSPGRQAAARPGSQTGP